MTRLSALQTIFLQLLLRISYNAVTQCSAAHFILMEN